MANGNQEREELHRAIWAIADELRGSVDGWDFKAYVLGMMFYRYISENLAAYIDEGEHRAGDPDFSYAEISDEMAETAREDMVKTKGFFILPSELFCNLKKRAKDDENLNVTLEGILKHIEESAKGSESEKNFSGLFEDVDVNSNKLGKTVAERNAKIVKLLNGVSDMKLGDYKNHNIDTFGDAYEFLMSMYASNAGKSGGEFFTPAGPSKLCATLAALGLDEAKTVGDCTCGSASMLLEVQKHLTTGKVGHFYGQEKNATTYNLSRMNMIMHGVDWQNFDIYKGDTLTDDKYGDTKMTVQVCNPPYSLKWSSDKKFEDDPRYSGVGKLAPKSAADLAFVEHMIYHMDDEDGRVAVLLPHGVLFRGGAEEAIRKYIIKDLNRLDAVIGLPANLFHGTGIPVCVLVLKSKRNGNSGNILFIDASKEFKPGKNQNTLEQEHIDKIVDAYEKRQDIDKFAHVADMSEIIENDYNLNIPRYVDTFEEEEPVDLSAVRADIQKLDAETKAAIDKAERFLKELRL